MAEQKPTVEDARRIWQEIAPKLREALKDAGRNVPDERVMPLYVACGKE